MTAHVAGGDGTPLVSVLMPCLNPGPYLQLALDSLCSQSFRDWELVVQDAGSTDGSRERLEQLALADPRVRVVVEHDLGQSDALNRALQRARGTVIGWLNADDLLLPGTLEAVQAALDRAGISTVVYGDWELIDESGASIRRYSVRPWSADRFLSHGCYIFSGAIFWPRDLLLRTGGWNSSLHFCMDLDMLLRLGHSPAVHAGQPLAALRRHAAAKSGIASAAFMKEATRLRLDAARTWRARVASLRITIVMLGCSWTSTIRFGRRYSRIRPSKRR